MTQQEQAHQAQLVKQATEQANDIASRGFITHLKAAGVRDEAIAELHGRYIAQRDLREAKFNAGASAILG